MKTIFILGAFFFTFFFTYFTFKDSTFFSIKLNFLTSVIKVFTTVLHLWAVQAFDQVRWPREGFPSAWQRPLCVLIRYRRIRLKRTSSDSSLFILDSCDRYILIIFRLSSERSKKFFFSLKNVCSSNLLINLFRDISESPGLSEKRPRTVVSKDCVLPPYKNPRDQ